MAVVAVEELVEVDVEKLTQASAEAVTRHIAFVIGLLTILGALNSLLTALTNQWSKGPGIRELLEGGPQSCKKMDQFSTIHLPIHIHRREIKPGRHVLLSTCILYAISKIHGCGDTSYLSDPQHDLDQSSSPLPALSPHFRRSYSLSLSQ